MARCGCNTGCSCALADGDGTTISGTGLPLNPWKVNLDLGLIADDTDCMQTSLSGTGTSADPYVISVDPIIAPEPNGLSCGPNGLSVSPSSDPGNILIIGGDGDLYVPPGGGGGGDTFVDDGVGTSVTGTGTPADPFEVNIDTGCGLEIIADEVAANVAPWPFDCPQDVNATDVYCSPTTGQLQGPPPTRSEPVFGQAASNVDVGIAAGNDRTITATVLIDLTDWCEDGLALLSFRSGHTVDSNTGGSFWRTFADIDIPSIGIASVQASMLQLNSPSYDQTFGGDLVSNTLPFVLPAGFVHSVSYTARVFNDDTAAIASRRIVAGISGTVVTHRP